MILDALLPLHVGTKSLDGGGFFSRLFGGGGSASGQSVTPESAMTVSSVLACVRVLSETLASTPLPLYRRTSGGKERATDHPLYRVLHDAPNEWQTSFEWREMMMGHLALRGNGYNQIVPGPNGSVSELIPLPPDKMKVEKLPNRRLLYTFTDTNGVPITYTQDQIFHIRGMSSDGLKGDSLIGMARNAVGLGIATEKHGSSLFKNGAQPGVVLEYPHKLTFEQADEIVRRWDDKHAGSANAFRTAVLMEGMKATELGMTNVDSQFLESRRFQIEEIARIFRVPLHLIGDLTRSTNNNIEHQSLEFVKFTMMPWFIRWETAINRALIDPDDGVFAEFNVDGLMRGDSAARSEFYVKLFSIGVFNINEIREKENMNNIGSDGDKRFSPLNMTTIDKAGEEPAPPAPPVVTERTDDDEQDEQISMALDKVSLLASALAELQASLAERIQRLESVIESDRLELLEAVKTESYETAAALRDQIVLLGVEKEKLAGELSANENKLTELETARELLSSEVVAERGEKDSLAGIVDEFKAGNLVSVSLARSLLSDDFQRMLRREINVVLSAAAKPDCFAESIEKFYVEHEPRLSESLSNAVALLKHLGENIASEQEIAAAHCAESLHQLMDLKCSNETMLAKVTECVQLWNERQPKLKGEQDA